MRLRCYRGRAGFYSESFLVLGTFGKSSEGLKRFLGTFGKSSGLKDRVWLIYCGENKSTSTRMTELAKVNALSELYLL